MPFRTLSYECNYCGKLMRSKNIAIRHEKTCVRNPDHKNCLRCKNCKKDVVKTPFISRPVCAITGKLCSRAISADCENFERIEW